MTTTIEPPTTPINEGEAQLSALELLRRELAEIPGKLRAAAEHGDGRAIFELRERYAELPTLIKAAEVSELIETVERKEIELKQAEHELVAAGPQVEKARKKLAESQEAYNSVLDLNNSNEFK